MNSFQSFHGIDGNTILECDESSFWSKFRFDSDGLCKWNYTLHYLRN